MSNRVLQKTFKRALLSRTGRHRPLSTAGLLVPLLVAAGCGTDWRAETHPVEGKVIVNGEPAAGALVHLHASGEPVDERNSSPWGKVASDGSFQLTTYEVNDGAPVGDYQLTLVWPEDTSKPSLFDRLGRKYDQPHESPWSVTVTEGTNVLPPVEIEKARLLDPDKQASAPF